MLTAESRRLGAQLTLKDCKDALVEQFRMRMTDVDDDEVEDEGEFAGTTFQGICYNCGKPGHRAVDCKAPRKKNNRFQGTCNLCGLRGHKRADCWEDERNKDRRPRNWKSRNNSERKENAAVVTNGDSEDEDELLLFMCQPCTDMSNDNRENTDYYASESSCDEYEFMTDDGDYRMIIDPDETESTCDSSCSEDSS